MMSDADWRGRLEQRWALADTMGALKVQDIPIPWTHSTGRRVVDIEFPADRPAVVEVVFEDGTRFSETRDSRYIKRADGRWDYPDLD